MATYPHQTERLTEALERAGLEALVATTPENVAYLTGFRSVSEGPAFAVFARQGTALVVPVMSLPSIAADAIDVDHVECFGEAGVLFAEPPTPIARRVQAMMEGCAAAPADALAKALERLANHRGPVGVDEDRLTHDGWQSLSTRLADFTLIPGAAALATARRVKGPYEIDCLGQALRIAEEALDAVVQIMDRGMTEREAVALYSTEIIKRGAWPRPSIVAMGESAAVPEPWPTERALRRGDLVRLDVGCWYKGYHATVGRTAVLGEPSPRQEAAHRAIQAGVDTAVGAIAPGVAAGRVFDAAAGAVRMNGLPHYECLHVGHGIGLEAGEPPYLTSASEAIVELGEVLTIEAPFYEIGSIGVTVKETVLVTSAGAQVLNRSHRGLVILD